MQFEKHEKQIDQKVLWDAHDLIAAGFSRSTAYQLLHRKDVPVIRVGSRLFVRRERFLRWLDRQQIAGTKD